MEVDLDEAPGDALGEGPKLWEPRIDVGDQPSPSA